MRSSGCGSSVYVARLARHLEELAREDRRRIVRATAPTARHDFSSNDYLGLARDPRVVAALASASRAGATGARLLSGAAPEHRALETELARALGREAALLFGSGYLAAAGTVAALAPFFACVYSDAQNHACLIDGIRLGRTPKRVVPHRDFSALADDPRPKLVVTESLFGMDGDRADVGELLAMLGPDDALLVDEAHTLGIDGPRGAGACAPFDDPRVIVIGTLSKSFAAAGGFVAGPAVTIDFLANTARTFVFDTAPPPALAAAALEAVRIAFADEARRSRVRAHAQRLARDLTDLGFARPDGEPSHVVSIVFGDAGAALAVQARLAERDVLAPAIRPPTVARGTSRIRIGLTAAHDDADIDALVAALARCRPLARTS